MPRFEPFSATRYASNQNLEQVSAPPYDVLSDSDVHNLLAQHPNNIVAIDVPLEGQGPDRYTQAAALLRQWLQHGVMVRDDAPSFTLYRMSFTDEAGQSRETVGVLGALEVVDLGAPGVLPHERTTPKAKSDRLDLTRATSTNLSPVWGLSLASGLTALLSEPGEPVGTCTDEQGVRHAVERVSDADRCAAIAATVGASPVVIADGHHRYAIGRTFRDETRDQQSALADAAELTLTYVGELVQEQLSVAAIHRLFSGVTLGELEAELAKSFQFSDAGTVAASHARSVVDNGSLCLVRPDGSGSFLTPLNDAFDGVRDLDSARLEHALRDLDQAEFRYQHGVSNIVQTLAAGDAVAGVLLRPVSVAEIQRTADEGLLMPPKSTFFTPKLRTGLVIRQLD